MISPIAPSMLPMTSFLSAELDEDRWFAERERAKQRPSFAPVRPREPFVSSAAMPPPLGDALADRWFR